MLGECMCVVASAHGLMSYVCLINQRPTHLLSHTYTASVCCNMMDSARAKGLISGSAPFHWLATPYPHPHTCTIICVGWIRRSHCMCLYTFIVRACACVHACAGVLSLCAQVPKLIRWWHKPPDNFIARLISLAARKQQHTAAGELVAHMIKIMRGCREMRQRETET